jgi:hypothetical protein
MDEVAAHGRMSDAGITVAVDETLQLATLRHFRSDGAFAAAVRQATGAGLPRPLEVLEVASAHMLLAWRSPTDTLCITAPAARLADLATRLADVTDGCLVELTGALRVLRLTGSKVSDLLCRLGSSACVPRPGEARRGRLADVPVLTVAVRADEVLLVVDRVYLSHLLAWIRETLLDLAEGVSRPDES